MDKKISSLFDQLRNRPQQTEGEINPFAAALTEMVAGGQFQQFTQYGGGGDQ